jgi:hypothetical protein
MTRKPPFRKLRGYAFDPSLSLQIDTALINEITYKVRWESDAAENKANASTKRNGSKQAEKERDGLRPGPRGEYVEVIDYDPTVQKFYAPVDLNERYILAQDGLEPSSSNPQFHQQMVYAVAMTTIANFEAGLGRPVLWSPHRIKEKILGKPGAPRTPKSRIKDEYVPTLRIYPHAMRDANAYYSPQKKALLFGYFAARPADVTLQMPDSLMFTCLSHDIVAHETTHAILDGLRRKYTEDTNPDVLAFHEAFADVVALFQHFTFEDVLKNQIAATRGDLGAQNLLGKLAQEFGIAIGSYGALRDAIGDFDEKHQWKPKKPTGDEYRTIMEPHGRGSILVAAVFEAFLTIYKNRVADLLRIASAGSGVLPEGALHPDLVNRLAAEAAKASRHVLNMCIRALDYCPPVDVNFGDFLRALITADADLVADDERDYRLAFIDAFRKRGIYPSGIKHLSVESLIYPEPETRDLRQLFETVVEFLREYRNKIIYATERKDIFEISRKYIAGSYGDEEENVYGLHRRLATKFDGSLGFEKLTGLMFEHGWQALGIPTSHAYRGEWPSFSVHSLHLASRVGPNGNQINQIIIALIQRAHLRVEKDGQGSFEFKPTAATEESFVVNGGCTLIFDLDSLELKHAIIKPLLDIEALEAGKHQLNQARCLATYKYQTEGAGQQSQFRAYFGMNRQNPFNEPFNFLHND